MIGILLAAQLAAQIERGLPADLSPPGRPEIIQSRPLAGLKACKGSPKLSTADAAQLAAPSIGPERRFTPRRLIDLPPGEICLTDGG